VKHKQVLVVLVAVLALTLGSLGVVHAILFGEPDGDAHPYVGLMVADVDGEPAWRCSGTLIAPTVFLTAGHCVYGATAARVWFDTDLTDNVEYPYGGETSVEGTPIPHPGYSGLTFPNTSDVGLVILEEPVLDVGFGTLPDIGLAEELNTAPGVEALLNIVGYGVQLVKPEPSSYKVRYQATPMLVELVGAIYSGGWSIHVSSNPGKGGGTGGACFGDSGGPALASTDSNVVVGVASFVSNSNCRGAGYYYRVDTEYAQDFVNQYLP
jgi:hypothetical protein